MIYVLIFLLVFFFFFLMRMWRTRSRMESIIISEHRDFLRKITLRKNYRIPVKYAFSGISEYMQFVEVNGQVIRYDSVFSNKQIISSLNNAKLDTEYRSLVFNKKVVQFLFIVIGLQLAIIFNT